MMNNTEATNITNSTSSPQFREPFRNTLIAIYSIVLLAGSTGLTVMMSILKTNIRSLTTTVFLNLMVAHFLFLLTVPFRIYYYVSQKWHLPHALCKMVSAMIHIHMYMVFVIYAIVLTLRFLQYYKKTQRTEFYRRLHAMCASACLWSILLVVMLPTVLSQYGHKEKDQDTDHCFNFDDVLSVKGIYALNMTLSIFIAVVSFVLTCFQTIVLCSLLRKHGASSRFQQEFWVQMKNLCFVFIMLICLVPYHLFRIHYLNETTKPHEINEVFLAITALTCCDMLTFTGKGMCHMC
ncbi:probable G-protein coupled receptor 141 [Triplophysa rosa]|nr:probable G-protein coupled receptor 141 [Triplophysa rosa]